MYYLYVLVVLMVQKMEIVGEIKWIGFWCVFEAHLVQF